MSFDLDLSAFANRSEAKMSQIARRVFIKISNEVIENTPVDSSRARNNWLPDINKFASHTTEETGRQQTKNKARVKDTTMSFKLGDKLTLTNNLDYIEALEYGLYPNPVKRGSPTGVKVDGKMTYEIKTIGGYSKQAPTGMVRIAFRRAKKTVKEEAKKAQKIKK